MIIGVGNDVVDVRRVTRVAARYPQRFPRYILTAAERGGAPPARRRAQYLAGRWAAKEALAKALGCGLRAPLGWQQISVEADGQGQPRFVFAAAAAEFMRRRGVRRCHLSISHDGDYAAAVVIAEGE